MSRNSMDDLLSAFDPLHTGTTPSSSSSSSSLTSPSASKAPLFPPSNVNSTAPHQSSSSSSSLSSTNNVTSTGQQQQPSYRNDTTPTSVSLSQAPLDLLSLYEPSNAIIASTSSSSAVSPDATSHQGGSTSAAALAAPGNDVQTRAAKRQSDLLQELQDAEQNFDVSSGPSTSPLPHNSRPRRSSLGFSPPRRMSKSGLMHDESYYHQHQSHGHGHGHGNTHHTHSHNHSRESSSSIHEQRRQHSSNNSGQHQQHFNSAYPEIAPQSPPPTMISEEPSELFHPSSPPAGATLEALRQKGYFGAASAASAASSSFLPPPHPTTTDPAQAQAPPRQRRTSTSDREAFQSFNSGVVSQQQQQPPQQNKSRSSFIANALRAPPPPFSSPSLKQSSQGPSSSISSSNSRPPLIPPPPSASSSSRSVDIQPTHHTAAIESAPPSAKPRTTKKHTFDFPTFGSLGHSSGSNVNANTSNAAAQQHFNGNGRHASAPNSRIGSPASSMIIDSEPLPPIVLKVPAVAESSKRVLTDDIADGIRPALPSRIKLCKTWSLLYSLDAYGTSLNTLYDRVHAGIQRAAGGCVLVVKDMEGGIFGAYVNEAFKKSELYYGNGECFLWRVDAFPSDDKFRVGPIVKCYRWTARNDYLILSDSSFLSVGGGDGKFGLWIDSSFDKGFTTTCPAFANEPLCSPSLVKTGVDGQQEGKFEIMAVECWAVG